MLDLDYTIWKGREDLESDECIAQGREIFRELVVLFATAMERFTKTTKEILDPLVEALLRQRNRFREQERWEAADAIRRCLENANVVVEDTPKGSRWRVKGR